MFYKISRSRQIAIATLTSFVIVGAFSTYSLKTSHGFTADSPCATAAVTIKGTIDDDHILGTEGDDVIFGYGGDDVIIGKGGNDTLCGGGGNDVLRGQDGDDILVGSGGDDVIYGGYGNDYIEGFGGNDYLYGNSGDDRIYAHVGDDTLIGGGGNDYLDAGSGNDNLMGSAGNDVCLGGPLHGYDIASSCEESTEIHQEVANNYERPKVVLTVMLDDADYHDVGYSSTDAVTPFIDSLMADGIKFTDSYASSGICSPTRVSVLTGESPIRFGLNRLWPDAKNISEPGDQYFWSQRGIPEYEETLGESMKKHGYSTFHIGKWHVGKSQLRFSPNSKGFDEYAIMKSLPYEGELDVEDANGVFQTSPQTWRATYQADRIIEHIEEQSQLQVDEKIFVNWWPIEPHTPLYVPPTFSTSTNQDCCNFDLTTKRGQLLATMYAWDQEFGRIITYLKEKDLYEDSLIVFTSDNGGYRFALTPNSDRDFTHGKGQIYEGGIRVPMVFTWPAVIEPSVTAEPITSLDLYPTLMGLIKAEQPEAAGVDMSSLLENTAASIVRDDPLFWQLRIDSWRKYEDETSEEQYAIREGCMKLIKGPNSSYATSSYELYDVCVDSLESNNLTPSSPAVAAQMKEELLLQRMSVSKYGEYQLNYEDLVLADDDRLDIHQDDITIDILVEPGYASGTIHNLYKRGEGLSLTLNTLDPASTTVEVELKGIVDKSFNDPEVKTIKLSAPFPNDGLEHRVMLVIRGYLRDQSSISVYVDEVLAVKKASHPSRLDPKKTVAEETFFAIVSERVPATLGGLGISLRNYSIYLTAILPHEIVD